MQEVAAADTTAKATPPLAVGASAAAVVDTSARKTGPPPVAVAQKTAAALAIKRPASAAPAPRSNCPRVVKAGTLTLLVDSVRNQKPNAKLAVNYDVCGLEAGAPYTAQMTLRKLNQSRFKRALGSRQQDVTVSLPGAAIGPRTRRRRVIDLKGLSSGRYALDVVVTDAKGRRAEKRREFELLEK